MPLNKIPWARALHFDVDDAATAVGSVHSSKQVVAAECRLWIFKLIFPWGGILFFTVIVLYARHYNPRFVLFTPFLKAKILFLRSLDSQFPTVKSALLSLTILYIRQWMLLNLIYYWFFDAGFLDFWTILLILLLDFFMIWSTNLDDYFE